MALNEPFYIFADNSMSIGFNVFTAHAFPLELPDMQCDNCHRHTLCIHTSQLLPFRLIHWHIFFSFTGITYDCDIRKMQTVASWIEPRIPISHPPHDHIWMMRTFSIANFQMGYANIKQRGQGLHLRQFARAFIIDDGNKRIAFVSVDGAMISHAVKRDVCSIVYLLS